MTAFLSFPFGDRIEVLADGAVCAPDGVLMGAAGKLHVSDHVPLVVTGRGGHGDLTALAGNILALSACGSVDETIEALDGVLSDLRQDQPDPVGQNFEVVVACYSETTGPRHFMFRSFATEDEPALSLIDYSDRLLGGGPSFDANDMATATGLSASDFADGAALPGLLMLEYLRGIPGRDERNPNGVTAHWIGGHCDHAVISVDGVSVARIHTWSDEVGRPIDPRCTVVPAL